MVPVLVTDFQLGEDNEKYIKKWHSDAIAIDPTIEMEKIGDSINFIMKQIKRTRVKKTILVEAIERNYPELNCKINGLVHSIQFTKLESDDECTPSMCKVLNEETGKKVMAYQKKGLDIRTKYLVLANPEKDNGDAKDNGDEKDNGGKKENDQVPEKRLLGSDSSLDSVVSLMINMFESLSPMEDLEFWTEIKKIGINKNDVATEKNEITGAATKLIKYIETYNETTTGNLKKLVKFYLKYREQVTKCKLEEHKYVETEEDRKNLCDSIILMGPGKKVHWLGRPLNVDRCIKEVITFLLLKRFNCEKAKDQLKEVCSKMNQLFIMESNSPGKSCK
jgi:hypothetical protein